MRPIMHSLCNGCGCMLEHDSDPRTVLCGGCERDRRMEARLVPPPTTDQRGKRKPPPPEPPPMRSVKDQHAGSGFGILVLAVMCVSFGFICGFLARGGV